METAHPYPPLSGSFSETSSIAHSPAEDHETFESTIPITPESHLGQPSTELEASPNIERRPSSYPLESIATGHLLPKDSTGLSSKIPESMLETERDLDEGSPLDFDWRLIDIPLELRLVQIGTPQEVCQVIRDFWQQCEAIQASTRSFQDFVTGAEVSAEDTHDGNDSEPTSTTSNSSTGRISVESVTTVGSDKPKASDAGSSKDILDSTEMHRSSSTHGGRSLGAVFSRFINGKDILRHGGNHGSSISMSRRGLSKTGDCASCFDDVPQESSVKLTCQHSYCPPCFTQLVLTAMRNENFFPPRCCLQHIPRKKILQHLSRSQVLEYGFREKEYSTPAKDRWYCRKCGKWFEPIIHTSWTQCSHCKYQMCLVCRGEVHFGTERCPQDRNLQATLEEAEFQGWKSCYNCKSIIELVSGCRHISCKCGAQFW